MTTATIDHEALNQEHIEANIELAEVSGRLIAIATAMTFARCHFSSGDEWAWSDELISRICGPLEGLLCDTAGLVTVAKARQKAACQAMSEYHKAKPKTSQKEQ